MAEALGERAGGAGAAWLARGCVGVVALVAAVQSMVTREAMPGWEADPFVDAGALVRTGLSPSAWMALDVAVLAAAAAGLVSGALARRAVGAVGPGLWLVGAVALAWRWAGGGGGVAAGLEHAEAGLGWTAAVAAAVGVQAASHDALSRRVLRATLLGLVGVLVARGVHQVLVEHPLTVRAFERNPLEAYAARGWTPGSTQAELYRRRLVQAEATGWYGLSNVFATVSAMGGAMLLTLAAGRLRRAWGEGPARRGGRGIRPALATAGGAAMGAALAAALAAMGVWLSRSAGGMGALLLASAAGVVAVWLGPGAGAPVARARLAWARVALRWAPLALPAAVLGGVVLRGMLGAAWPSDERPELSLLFRAFYVDTAWRVWLEQPLLGVGPDGFQAAYALAKPALSPENVMSPHSVALDWLSRVGVGGAAWIGVLAWLAWRCGGALAGAGGGGTSMALDGGESPDNAGRDADASGLGAWLRRPGVAWLVLTALAGTLVSARVEQAAATPESALMRLVGLGLWVWLGGMVLHASRRRGLGALVRAATAAGAVAFVVHAQIEMTPVWPGAMLVGFAWLGVAGGAPGEARGGAEPSGRVGRGMAMLAAAGAVGLAGLGARSALAMGVWEGRLAEAADAVRAWADVRAEAARSGGAGVMSSADAAALSRRAEAAVAALGVDLPVRGADAGWGLEFAARAAATERLGLAAAARPGHRKTALAWSRELLSQARLLAAGDRPGGFQGADREAAQAAALRLAGAAVEVAHETASVHRPELSASWGWLATVQQAKRALDAELSRAGAVSPPGAAERAALERAAELDPHSAGAALRAMRAAAAAGDAGAAQGWAERALRAHGQARLDPLTQLGDAEVREAEGVLGDGEGAAAGARGVADDS